MRSIHLVLLAGLMVGCAHGDRRLEGTWKSNREETMAAILRTDPKWADATPERRERLSLLFGNMTVTYSNQVAIMVTPASSHLGIALPATTNIMRYAVVERGPNHVVIQPEDAKTRELFMEGKVRIEFVDGATGYWIDMGTPMRNQKEKFDRVLP